MQKIIVLILSALFLFGCSDSCDFDFTGINPDLQQVNNSFDSVETISGQLQDFEWHSDYLGESREITVYTPPSYDAASEYGVLVVTDGIATGIAPYIEYLIIEKTIDPIIVIGLNHRKEMEIDTLFSAYKFDFRNMEFLKGWDFISYYNREEYDSALIHHYLPKPSEFKENPDLYKNDSLKQTFSRRYERFCSYITDEVVPFVKDRYALSPSLDQWSLGGFSSGGAFVYGYTTDHPGVFGNAIVMSPGGMPDQYDFSKSTSNYFIAAGDKEKGFLTESKNYLSDFDSLGISYIHHTYDAGHDFKMWLTFYLWSIEKIYCNGN